jgi:glycosyltransferase involved in cell wall biosynthesis
VYKKNILIITRWFPNLAEPVKGIFTKNIVDAQAISKKYSFVVISPIPYVPNINISLLQKYVKFRDISLVEKMQNYKIYRPKYKKLPYPYLKSFEWYPYFLQVLKTIKKEDIKFDLIHCHGIYPDGLVGVKIGRYFNKKVVLHVHESYISTAKELNIYRNVFKHVDRIVPVSKFQSREILKIDERLRKKCSVIYNGLKTDKKNISLNNYLEGTNRTIRLIFVGHLIFTKGLDILLKALKFLNNSKYKFSLDVIGNGEKQLEYKTLSEKYGLGDKVNFIGEIDNTSLLKKMKYYNYLVLPSRYETFGVVLIEAMSCGLPVIASKVGAIPEIVASEEVGILVEPNNSGALAEGIVRAINKKWDREKIRKYAENFSIGKTVEKIEEVYNKLLDS